jgi:hypothetical protein
MKNVARLVLFFSVCFVIVFLLSAITGFLRIRIETLRMVPVRGGINLEEFLAAAQRALPAALYLSILFSLSYTVRRKIPASMSIIGLWALALGFIFAFSLGSEQFRRLPQPANQDILENSGEPGLILSQAETTIVLLKAPGDIRGPRVVSIPDRPLIYQEVPLGPNNTVLGLPPLAFRNEAAYFIRSLLIDFSLTARQFAIRLEAGLIPFIIYAASLIFLLTSLRFILELGNWPLANLFLGAVVFRGILALETFINSQEIRVLLNSLAEGRLREDLISPLIFSALGIFVLLYTILVYLAGNRRNQDD